MKLSSSFSVPEESVRVFELFLDAPTMRSCIPGCQELVRVDDTHYTGRLVNEIAHVRFDAAFSVEIVGIELPHEVRAVLKGEDRRLASSLKLDAVLQVRPEGDASMVSYSMEIAMWGKLGRMGTGSAVHAAACRALGAFDGTSELESIKAETLVVVGEEDYATPVAMAEVIAERIPGARLEVLRNARHLSLLEREDVWSALATHLGIEPQTT